MISRTSAKKVYVESYGCTANKFDLEIMLALLISAGYRLVEDVDSADTILINTCGVKRPTEDRMIGKLRVLSKVGKPIVIAGCLPRINMKAILKAAPNFSAILDPRSIDKVLLALKSSERGEKNRIFFSNRKNDDRQLVRLFCILLCLLLYPSQFCLDL